LLRRERSEALQLRKGLHVEVKEVRRISYETSPNQLFYALFSKTFDV
jgi:hypothetical protein